MKTDNVYKNEKDLTRLTNQGLRSINAKRTGSLTDFFEHTNKIIKSLD